MDNALRTQQQGDAAKLTSDAMIAPSTTEFDESKGVAGRVNSLVSQDNPLMQTAQTRAAQAANARGLRNSSTAVQAGQQAVIETATPIASADAQLFQQQALTNQAAKNRASEVNAGNITAVGSQNLSLMEQARQSNQSAGLERSRIASTEGMAARQLENQRVIATMDADSRLNLANVEAKYKTQIAGDQNISNAWGTMMDRIGVIQANPDLDPATKQAQIDGILGSFKAFAGFWSQASGRDVTKLLDFGMLGAGGGVGGGSAAAPAPAAGGAPNAQAGGGGGLVAGGGGSVGDSSTGTGPGSPGAAAVGDTEGSTPGTGANSATPSNPGFSTGVSNSTAGAIGAGLGMAVGVPGLGAVASAANAGVNAIGAATASPGTGGPAASAGSTAAAAAGAAGHSAAAQGAAGQAAADASMSGASPAAAAAAGAAAAAAADGQSGAMGEAGIAPGTTGDANSAGAGAAASAAGVGDSAGSGDGQGDAGSGGGGGGGGSSCVMATAMVASGAWAPTRKADLVRWCIEAMHGRPQGERIRRGYQFIGAKVGVPALRQNTLLGRYLAWTFVQTTNLLRGEPVAPLVRAHSRVWLILVAGVGACISTRTARRAWADLYREGDRNG